MTTDFNDDGWPDIYVACDSTASILYRNNHDGTFTDVALETGSAYNEDGQAQAGMGVAVGDYNGDGFQDIFKTHFADDLPALYKNTGRGFFEDASRAAGFDHTRYVQWGTGLVDFDNDGWLDIIDGYGQRVSRSRKTFQGLPASQPRISLSQSWKRAIQGCNCAVWAGSAVPHSSRGCAFGDFDNDGDIDVLVMNMNEPPQLRNDYKGANNWLKLKLIGAKSNRSAIGARVRVKAGARLQVQEITSQSSYYSHNDMRVHFGMSENKKADQIEIRWPNGQTETIKDVAAGQIVTIKEGSGIIKQPSTK